MTGTEAAKPFVLPRAPIGAGNCPRCHRDDVTHRIVVGEYELRTCALCADAFKRENSARIEPLVR